MVGEGSVYVFLICKVIFWTIINIYNILDFSYLLDMLGIIIINFNYCKGKKLSF